LPTFRRVEENGILNNSIIQVQPKKLMSLVFERNGYNIGFNFDENISIGMAFIHYLIETEDENSIIELINNENSISFIYNQHKYNIKDKSCIKHTFPHLARILVIEHGNVIVIDGVIEGKVKGEVEGTATPKIHISDIPDYGGASLHTYGHVMLVDEIPDNPERSSSNTDKMNKNVIALAASPYAVHDYF
jgi:hypothetical protein